MSLADHIENLHLVSCSEDTPVREVAELMKVQDVGVVLILDVEQRPVGIVTDRDLVIRVLCDGLDAEVTPVVSIMTASVETVREDQDLYRVIARMKEGGIRRMPIVDQEGRARALLSAGDISKVLIEELGALAQAGSPGVSKLSADSFSLDDNGFQRVSA